MPYKKHLLTKSAFINALNCERFFWVYQNERERLQEPDEAQQALFDQGHKVGDMAKMLYPDGIEIDWDAGHEAGIAQTAGVLGQRRPVFEAGFQHRLTHARADILAPSSNGRWDLIEVKSSTGVKEEHLDDVAFQKHVYNAAGIRIGRCFVMHVDKGYVRRGEPDPKALFARTDVTTEIKPLAGDMPARIKRLLSIMSKAKAPAPNLGTHCAKCPLYDECWFFLPERHVFQLNRARQKAYQLMEEDILAIRDIPDDYPLTARQSIQVACEKAGKPHVQPRQIQAFLGLLKYPLHFLDFETFMAAIPPYDESRPYEQVPFQYSLHVIPAPGRRATHYSYLSDGKADPRPEVLSTLKKRLGRTGSIVAYNAAFEMRVLRSCAGHFDKYAAWCESLMPRFADLMAPFRDFHYYHPDQEGSASLKAVLPAMTGKSYDNLAISDGATAGLRFCEMAFGGAAEPGKKQIRRALEAYCRQDTQGMIDILKKLRNLGK